MKMPWWAVPIIGLVVAALASGAIFYFLIRPQQDRIRQLEENIRQQEAVIAQREQAKQSLEKAKREAQKARERWRQIRRELALIRLPDPTDPAAVWAAGIAFQKESQGFFERDLRKFLAETATRHNLDLSYASIPQYVLASLQTPVPQPNGFFRWGQMTLQVDGRFGDILRFMEELPQFTRPIVVQAPQFQLLPSGKVRATIPVEIYALVETPVERLIMEGKEVPPDLLQRFQQLLSPMSPGQPALGAGMGATAGGPEVVGGAGATPQPSPGGAPVE